MGEAKEIRNIGFTILGKEMAYIDLYCKRIQFLRDNIAPDDIYEFAEQALTGGEFFLNRWSELQDIKEISKDCLMTRAFVNSFISMRKLCDDDYKGGIDIANPLEFE